MLVLLLLSILLLVAGSGQAASVNQADEDRAIGMIRQLITNLEQEQPPRIINPTAKLIRLIFHDCIVSGCDGCVDLGHSGNNGLAEIFEEVNTLYDSQFNDSGMSRADFYALAGVVAVRVASDQQQCSTLGLPPDCTKPVPDMSIVYGRKDCATSPNSIGDFGFPDAHGDLDHVMEVFRDGVGMTERQVVALLGAHTVGMAMPKNSGFQGPWTSPTDSFDNAFFRTLVANASGWHQSRLNFSDAPEDANPRFQWDTGNVVRMPDGGSPTVAGTMMLNTDMALFKRVAPDSSGRETDDDCRSLFTNCQPSRTADIVLEYANNNTRWHQDFGSAFQILIEHDYPAGALVAATDPSDSALSFTAPVLLLVTMGAIICTVFY